MKHRKLCLEPQLVCSITWKTSTKFGQIMKHLLKMAPKPGSHVKHGFKWGHKRNKTYTIILPQKHKAVSLPM